jgi:hypothetical protein
VSAMRAWAIATAAALLACVGCKKPGDKPVQAGKVDPASVTKAGIAAPIKGFAGIQESGFRVAYAPSSNPDHEQIRSHFAQQKIFDNVADALNAELKMPRTIDIQMADCGAVNAFYDPNNNRIIVCYELITYFAGMFKPVAQGDEDLAVAVVGATFFAFFHELGHAVIHQLELPAVGREEDAADQMATLILTSAGDDGVAMALHGAKWFAMQSDSGHETPFWDEHAFDQQRFYNVLCLVYGSGPDRYGEIVTSGALPKERAERCPQEYKSINASWEKLLAPYTRPADYKEPEVDVPIEAPTAPPRPSAPPAAAAADCEQVTTKVVELVVANVRPQLEEQLAKLPEDQHAETIAGVEERIKSIAAEVYEECGKRWSAEGRACVVKAATLDDAAKCPIPAMN